MRFPEPCRKVGRVGNCEPKCGSALVTAPGQPAYGQRFHISSTERSCRNCPVKLKLRRQNTQNKQLVRVMDICSQRSWSVGRRRLKSRHFPPKREIHGELGSAHAMNFGRNPKYLEVRSDSDAKRHRAQPASINNCPNRA